MPKGRHLSDKEVEAIAYDAAKQRPSDVARAHHVSVASVYKAVRTMRLRRARISGGTGRHDK